MTTSSSASGSTSRRRSVSIGQRSSMRLRAAAAAAPKPVSTRIVRWPERTSQTKKSIGIGPSCRSSEMKFSLRRLASDA
jgi:hypothetical protein